MSSNNANLLLAQAVSHHQNNKLADARPLYEKSLLIEPNNFDCLYFLGLLYAQIGEFLRAVDLLSKAGQLHSHHAGTFSTLGFAQLELKQYLPAIDSFKRALHLQPDLIDAHYNLGNALQDIQHHLEAIKSYDEALRLEKNNPNIFFNKANSLRDLRDFEAAIQAYDRAIAIQLNFAEAYSNKAGCLVQIGAYENAITVCRQALAINPDFATAHWNLAFCYLLLGDYENGWKEHEWRWISPDLPIHQERRNFDQPMWIGEQSLLNKTILLYAEQGLGDTLQFSRFATQVKRLGAKVILEVQKPLVSLLSKLGGVDQIIAKGDPTPAFDFQCPLMSLPLALKVYSKEIRDTSSPYLQTSKESHLKLESKLGKKIKPRIGIVWGGNPEHHNDWNRSIPLDKFIKLCAPQYQLVSIQKNISAADQALLLEHPEILHFENDLNDFSDTAALCELLDLVITVDTSVAHLAGGLGKETWILLPKNPDWRWLLMRADTEWYPSVRLYRQEALLNWAPLIDQVKNDLTARFSI
jgi:tetratricopeptide (TPR) repeat protein